MFAATVEVRVQRVVLEDHRDVAPLRRDVGDVLAADPHRAVEELLEARERPQRGRLPRAGRPDEDHQLAVVDSRSRASTAGTWVARVADRRLLEADLSHRAALLPTEAEPELGDPRLRDRRAASRAARRPPRCGPPRRAAPEAVVGRGARVRAVAPPGRVEGEQRGADDRRVGASRISARGATVASPRSTAAASVAVLRAQQPAAEHDVDRLVARARAARARRARTRRPRPPAVR